MSALIEFRDASNNQITLSRNGGKVYAYPQQSGTHYLVLAADSWSSAELTLIASAPPRGVTLQRFSSNSNRLGQYTTRRLPTEVYSEIPLNVGTENPWVIPARTLTTLDANEWEFLELPDDASRNGVVYFRNQAADGRPLPWERFDVKVTDRHPAFASLDSSVVKPKSCQRVARELGD